jgi:hypothetical protein
LNPADAQDSKNLDTICQLLVRIPSRPWALGFVNFPIKIRFINARCCQAWARCGIQTPAEVPLPVPLARRRLVLSTADARCVGRVFCCADTVHQIWQPPDCACRVPDRPGRVPNTTANGQSPCPSLHSLGRDSGSYATLAKQWSGGHFICMVIAMKPDNIELCSAIIVVNDAHSGSDSVRTEALSRLAELGIVQSNDGKWMLTATGRKMLTTIQDGDTLPNFT